MKMFPSPFDLGNGIPVPPEMCTLGALVRDIVNDESILKYAGSSEDQSPDGIHDVPDEGAVEKALKDIKKKLAATLGKDVIGNDSTSLKVLKLLL